MQTVNSVRIKNYVSTGCVSSMFIFQESHTSITRAIASQINKHVQLFKEWIKLRLLYIFLPALNFFLLHFFVRNFIQNIWFADKFIAVWNTYKHCDEKLEKKKRRDWHHNRQCSYAYIRRCKAVFVDNTVCDYSHSSHDERNRGNRNLE